MGLFSGDGIGGSLIGGVVGGPLGSLIGSSKDTFLGGKGKMGILGTGRFDPEDSAFAERQLQLADILAGRIGTDEGSVALDMLKKAQDQNLAQSLAAINSSRSLTPAQQARLAINSQNDNSTALARDAAILRKQEESQNIQNLASVLASGRGGDINTQQMKQNAFDAGAQRRSNLLSSLGNAAATAGAGGA